MERKYDTLDYYNRNANEYFKQTLNGDFAEIYKITCWKRTTRKYLREDDIDNLIKNRTLPSNLAAIQTKVLDTLDTMALQYLKRGIKT